MFSRKVSIALRVLIVVTALIVCGVVGVFLGYNYVLSQNSRLKNWSSIRIRPVRS